MLAGWHDTRWEVVVAGVLTNAYISLAYGALPALIVSEVDNGETGVATSLNGMFRKVGGAAAAALVGALLTPRSGGLAAESGFTAVFVLGAATAADPSCWSGSVVSGQRLAGWLRQSRCGVRLSPRGKWLRSRRSPGRRPWRSPRPLVGPLTSLASSGRLQKLSVST